MTSKLRGIAVTSGVASGPCFIYDPAPPVVEKNHIDMSDVEREKERLREAIRVSIDEVAQLRDRVAERLGQKEAAIFEAHLMMFEDEALLESTNQHIEADLMSAEWALWEASEEIAQMFASMEDKYFRARAADIYDVRTRILNHLLGRPMVDLRYLDEPCVVVARDLLPSDTAGLDPQRVLGFATEEGGPTSHSAILARQYGIPAVVAVPGLLKAVTVFMAQMGGSGKPMVVINANTGTVVIAPDEETLSIYQAEQLREQQRKQALQMLRDLPAETPDGVNVEIAANIGTPADAGRALEAGAEGIGLFRTEFLFLDRASPPTEEEQLVAYRSVLQTFAGKTVIIRTLDIGADKTIPYLSLPQESNPALGLRGIRLCLDPEYQHLFRTQVRALLLAAAEQSARLWIMFPMICDLRELRMAKSFISKVEKALIDEHRLAQPVLPAPRMGIMIETPAAAWQVEQLAVEADFFSIGTNDLAQYTLASDRTNARLGELLRPFHPAVMRAIAHTVRNARTHKRWVGVCGEMAADPRAAVFLLGLGVNELSMEASSFNAVKQVIRATSFAQAQAQVEKVLAADSTEAITAILSAAANYAATFYSPSSGGTGV